MNYYFFDLITWESLVVWAWNLVCGRFRNFEKSRKFLTFDCSSQWRAKVWWCTGWLLDYMPPYRILVLCSGIWWSLLDICCSWHPRWHHIQVSKPTFWRSLLTQHAYYSTYTLLTHCYTMCHCNEHKLSALKLA